MKKIFKYLLLIMVLVLLSSACSPKSNAELLNKAIQSSSIGDSAIKYTDDYDLSWRDFKKQDEEIQNYYLAYIKEIGEFISNADLKKVNEDDVDGLIVFNLKVNHDGKEYMLIEKYIYPETDYLIISIDDKTEYYFLNPEQSKELSNLVLDTNNNYPFNHISLMDYLIKENQQ